MPQPTMGARLGGSPAHQRLMLANLTARQTQELRRYLYRCRGALADKPPH